VSASGGVRYMKATRIVLVARPPESEAVDCPP
jgi:hypothetical protein